MYFWEKGRGRGGGGGEGEGKGGEGKGRGRGGGVNVSSQTPKKYATQEMSKLIKIIRFIANLQIFIIQN